MARLITVNTSTAKKLVNELEQLEELKKHILRLLPDGVLPHGSKLWWEKEVLQGEEEIKKGEFKTYKNVKSLISDLHKGI